LSLPMIVSRINAGLVPLHDVHSPQRTRPHVAA
jgi:hypothetical protein